MEALKYEATQNTPTINFVPGQGLLEIKGRSIPENSVGFYKDILEWIDDYGKTAPATTTVNIHLEYFNTASSKCILDVFKMLDIIQKGGNSEVTVNWHYDEDDEDMLEAGEDYEAIVSIPFKMIEVEEE